MLMGTTSVSKTTPIITYVPSFVYVDRYKNKLCLVNLLFVHCNNKKDKVERTLNDRKCSSTTIFCDCLKKKKGKLFARLTSNQI